VAISALAHGITIVICGLLLLVTGVRPQPLGTVARSVYVAGVLEAFGGAAFLLGTSLGSRSVVAVIASLYSVVTVLLAQITLHERISRVQVIGVAFALLGVALTSAV